jgi:protein-S-isoprenylcysteine O-methyltransferase Ste14
VSAGRSAAVRACQWAGGALFVASLGYFLFTYTLTFGEIVTGRLHDEDLTWNAMLFTAFALHHSVFARTPIRQYIARSVPSALERTFYVIIASLMLIAVCAGWRPVPGTLWRLDGGMAWVSYAGQAFGIWLTIWSAAIIDVRNLAGLPRSTDEPSSLSHAADAADFTTRGPYGWVRHPIYTGWFLLVFSVPAMTFTRLEFAVISCGYLLVAMPLEEETLRRTTGEGYARYQDTVRWRIVPGVY